MATAKKVRRTRNETKNGAIVRAWRAHVTRYRSKLEAEDDPDASDLLRTKIAALEAKIAEAEGHRKPLRFSTHKISARDPVYAKEGNVGVMMDPNDVVNAAAALGWNDAQISARERAVLVATRELDDAHERVELAQQKLRELLAF